MEAAADRPPEPPTELGLVSVVPCLGMAAGGPGFTAAADARWLAERGHDVTLLTTDAAKPANARRFRRLTHSERREIEDRVAPASVIFAPTGRPRRFARSPALRRRLEELVQAGTDVVIAHGIWLYPTLAVVRVCGRLRVPYVVELHGSLGPGFAKRGRLRKWLMNRLRPLGSASGFRVASTLEQEWASSLPVSVPRYLIRHSVAPSPEPPRSLEERDRTILWAGRLAPGKRPDIAVDSLQYLDKGYGLVVAGPDNSGSIESMRLRAQRAGVSDRVDFVGPLAPEVLRDLMRRSLVTLITSDSENYSLVAAESLAAGTPVATRAAVGVAELVATFGAGTVVGDSPRSVAEGIDRLVRSADGYRRALAGTVQAAAAITPDVTGLAVESMLASVSQRRESPQAGPRNRPNSSPDSSPLRAP